MDPKLEMSMINLNDFNITEMDTPPIGIPLCIRMVHATETYKYNNLEFAVEELSMARWDGSSWTLEPPYALFNFSPLTSKNKINEDTIVSHWLKATDEEISSWDDRMKFNNKYENLNLSIDENYTKEMYLAFLHSTYLLSEACKTNPALRPSVTIMEDLIVYMDLNFKNNEDGE